MPAGSQIAPHHVSIPVLDLCWFYVSFYTTMWIYGLGPDKQFSLEQTLILRECASALIAQSRHLQDFNDDLMGLMVQKKGKKRGLELKKNYSSVRAAVIYHCGNFISLACGKGIN